MDWIFTVKIKLGEIDPPEIIEIPNLSGDKERNYEESAGNF